ncbi:chromate transporter [Mycoplasmopsis ciconiae]|uniref:Chromate transporter n=1 Tax=Mycoplasmopsis ciconiae TaxID=561067 RepID=A0ABU7MMB5_9BACT|nr:chromate transporter [Mycoplasmopsis ciconiae]
MIFRWKNKTNKPSSQFWEVFWFIIKITFIGFGGGNALMPVIKKEAVDNKKWITNEEFEKIVVVTNSLPGPSIIQALAYISVKLLGKTKGYIVSIIAMIPHILLTFILFLLVKQLPLNYIYALSVGVLASIIGILAAFAYEYLKQSTKKLKLPLWMILFIFTFGFYVFVPAPFNIPVVAIVIVILVYSLYYWTLKKWNSKKENK